MRKVLVGLLSLSALLLVTPARAQTVNVWSMGEADGSQTVTSSLGDVGTLQDRNGDPVGVQVLNNQLVFDGNGRVVVPDEPGLDPQTQPFTVQVTVNTSVVPSTDYDLVRKGLTTDSKSYWKVELVHNSARTKAFALCKMRGYVAAVSAYHSVSMRTSGASLADGASHVISCQKTDTGETLSIDGVVRVTRSVVIGSVQNTADVSFGAKASVWEDMYTGTMDDVTYVIG